MYSKRDTRSASFTKSGPGRRHVQGDGTHAHLTVKQRRAGAFGKGLRNWITSQQRAAQSARQQRAAQSARLSKLISAL